jgi:hypothetical protein
MYRFLIVIEKGKRNFSAYSETVASLQGIGSKPPVFGAIRLQNRLFL